MISETVENSAWAQEMRLSGVRSHRFNPEGQCLAFAEAGHMQFEDGFHRGLPLLPPDLSEDPDSEPAAGAAGKGAKRLARPLRDGTAAGSSHLI